MKYAFFSVLLFILFSKYTEVSYRVGTVEETKARGGAGGGHASLLAGLSCHLGDLGLSGCLFLHRLDAKSHCLPQVLYSKMAWKRKEEWELWKGAQRGKKASPLGEGCGSPRGGYWEKVSTHMALLGTICTMAVSPDFRALGLSSSFLPERRSIFSLSSANLQEMWAVWQSSTGE